MMTKPWPMAKRPKSPTRFAVLARLIGDRKRGLINATTAPTTRIRTSRPKSFFCISACPTASSQHRVLGERGALQDAADRALVHHRDAVGNADHLLHVARDHQDRHARVRQRPHHVVDLLLGAHVDAARRLVEDDGARLHGQPLRQHHLLLVAARERDDRRLHPRPADAEPPPLLLGQRRLRLAPDEPRPGEAAKLRQRDILGDRKVEHHPAALTVLRHQIDPLRDRLAGRAHAHRLPVEPDRAGNERIDPEHRPRELGPPRADQPGEPEDLAPPHRQVNGPRRPGGGAGARDLQDRPAGRCRRRRDRAI